MRFSRFPLLFAALLPLSTFASGQAPPSYKGPVRAELLKYLSVRQVHAGLPVFVRVHSDWSGIGCTLRSGAIIEGKVLLASPRSKSKKLSEMALTFNNAQCDGMEMAPITFLIAAVSAAPADDLVVPVVRNMGNPRGVPENSAVSSLSQLSTQMQLSNQAKPAPARFPSLGEVSGIRGVKLDVAAGPEHSSVLSAKDKDIALNAHTEFILVPSSVAFDSQPQLSTPDKPAGSDGAKTSIDSIDLSSDLSHVSEASANFVTCAPPSCSTDLSATKHEGPSRPVLSIPIRALGYKPRPDAAITEIDDDQAIAWLGNGRVLLAFNAHRLVHREGLTNIDAPVRSIHAVLIDFNGNRAISTLDWELSDTGKFLWQLSPDSILVHAGHELRIYDSHLRLTSHLLLPGPLAFLRVSPNGNIISLGIIRERHTTLLHSSLQLDLGHQPAEDVDLMVLDRSFKTLAHSITASDILPPTLLNEGQVMLLAQRDHRYRIQFMDWQGRVSTLARFSSACTPELGSTAPDLLFIRSCQLSTGTPEFRVMRPAGRLLLRSVANVGELGQDASGTSSIGLFTVSYFHAAPSVRLGFPFHGTDLLGVEARVYRASDGKRIAAVHAEAPAPSHSNSALSPDGSHLAVIADAQLHLYSVPTN